MKQRDYAALPLAIADALGTDYQPRRSTAHEGVTMDLQQAVRKAHDETGMKWFLAGNRSVSVQSLVDAVAAENPAISLIDVRSAVSVYVSALPLNIQAVIAIMSDATALELLELAARCDLAVASGKCRDAWLVEGAAKGLRVVANGDHLTRAKYKSWHEPWWL